MDNQRREVDSEDEATTPANLREASRRVYEKLASQLFDFEKAIEEATDPT
jgi:hypothetical protein